MSRKHLLKAADIEVLEGVSLSHPMNPKVQRVTKSLGDPTGLTGFGIHMFETAPGADSTALHVHHFEDEALYVLSGTAHAQIGDEIFQIGPGDFLGYPKGGPAHIIRNTGAETLRCLVIGERLENDVIDYPDAGKRLTKTGSEETYAPLNND